MQISICGCGWLGLPLARHLKQSGHNIVATRRSEAGVNELKQARLTGLRYTLGDNLDKAELAALFQSELLILNIPPGRHTIQPECFVFEMTQLVRHARSQGVRNIIFVSTTAVYGEQQGVIKEGHKLVPETPSAKAHVQIEQHIQKTYGSSASILRLAGLTGEQRHPAKHLSGKHHIANPEHAVNLIHQLDVVTAIEGIINQKIYGECLHLCALEHPGRQVYYQWACQTLGIASPSFANATNEQRGKIIDARYSLEKLGIALNYPSPYDML